MGLTGLVRNLRRVPTAPADFVAAAKRYGRSVDSIARQYTNPVTGKRLSGEALLVKLGQGESGFRADADSGKAHGLTQFTPGSRQVAISKFGIDPNKNADSAVHAAALHLRGKINGQTGLAGYNPGMASYTGYILGQKIGNVLGKRSSSRGGGGGGRGGSAGSPSRVETSRGPATVDPGVASDAGVRLLGDALRGAPRSIATAPAAPAFSARPVTPAAYGGGLGFSGGGPSPISSLAAQLAEVGASDGQAASITPGETRTTVVPGTHGMASGGARHGTPGGGGLVPLGGGRARSARISIFNADPGRLKPSVLALAKKVSIISGRPLRLNSGAGHSRLTATGGVSQHGSGNATDIPAAGSDLTRLGRAALIAAGMPRAKALKQTGGLFNFPGGVQVIFNDRQLVSGSPHDDHLHISHG